MKKIIFLLLCLFLTKNLEAHEFIKSIEQKHFNAFGNLIKLYYHTEDSVNYLNKSIEYGKLFGENIVDSLMLYAETWQGEEVIVFIPLVVCLSPEKSKLILNKYKSGGSEKQKAYSRDLLGEITKYYYFKSRKEFLCK